MFFLLSIKIELNIISIANVGYGENSHTIETVRKLRIFLNLIKNQIQS